MSPLNIALLITMSVSAIFTVVLILMHSGKGTGVSDMIAAAGMKSIWEKNLDRLTVIFAVIFAVSIIVMTVTFPTGTIAAAS